MNEPSSRTAITFLRWLVAGLLLIHGITRIALGLVDDFGGFLSGVGFPFGTALAWLITGTEVLGSLLLALGRWIRPLALFFAAEMVAGILLVHAQEGWFVVGAGRNGMVYSVLLIGVLLAVAYGRPSGTRSKLSF